jgi:arsenate reductase
MAEAFLRRFGGDRYDVESAGLEPQPVNPLVIEVMKEEGFDLSGKATDSVFAFFKEGRLYDYVITVCAESENRCPLFPGVQRRLHWPFPDPSALEGTREERLARTREIRDAIREKVRAWVEEG